MKKIEAIRQLLRKNPGMQLAEIADHMGIKDRGSCFRTHVWLARRELGIATAQIKKEKVAKVDPSEVSFEALKESHKANFWKEKYAELEKKYVKHAEEVALVDRLIDEIKEMAPKSYDTAPKIPTFIHGKGEKHSAVLMYSDHHIGKIVHPGQTLGEGEYNIPIYADRLKSLENDVIRNISEVTVEVDELVLCLLGDMVDGMLNHASELGSSVTIAQQVYIGAHLMAQHIRRLSSRFKKIRIYTCVGNHGRFPSQHKMPTEHRYSNFDAFYYYLTEALTKDIKNVHWTLNKQPFQIFEANNFVFHAGHGDHLKGGDKAWGIPAHSTARMVNSTTAMMEKNGKVAPHYYLLGDKHRRTELSTGKGTVIINGAITGADPYSIIAGYQIVNSTQHMFLVHPKEGRSTCWDIKVDQAPRGLADYVLPDNDVARLD